MKWLLKSDPEEYGIDELKKDNKTLWTGVRNYQARNNLRTMKKGDEALFYHSNSDKAIVAIVKVIKEAMPDPTASEGDWTCIEIQFEKIISKPVTLEAMKAEKKLSQLLLIRNGRLSVMPVTDDEWQTIIKMGA